MLNNVPGLLNNPRKLLLVGGVGVLAILVLVITCNIVGGDEEDAAAPDPGFEVSVMSVEEQVAATVAASVPTEEPTPTPDIPATLTAAAEQTRVARVESSSGAGSLFALPDSAAAPDGDTQSGNPAAGDNGPFGGASFTRADERFLQEMGPALWYSVRLHLELESLLDKSPSDMISLDGQAKSEQAEYDSGRLGRELRVLEQRWDDLSPRVRDYGRHLEETIRLTQDAATNVGEIFNIARRGTEVSFDSLSAENRREIETLYWDAKELLNSFDSRMQQFGCSVCGELYRARDVQR